MCFAPAQRVLISGLKNYDYLNGSIGTVIGSARGGRFAVLVTCEETLYYDTINVERKISVHPRSLAPAHALPCLNAFYGLIDPPCGCKTRWADLSPTRLTHDADWVTTLCCGCKIAQMKCFPQLKRCKFHSSGEIFEHVSIALSDLELFGGTKNPTYNPRVPHVRLPDPIADNLSRMEDVNAPITGLQLPLASVPHAIYPNASRAIIIPLGRSSSVPTECSAESTTGTVPDDPSCFLDTLTSQRCSSGPVVPIDSNDHHLVAELASAELNYTYSNRSNDIPHCSSSSVPTDCSVEPTTGTVPDPSCFLDIRPSQRCSSGPVVPIGSNDHHVAAGLALVVPKRRKRRGGRKPKKNPNNHLKPPLEV